MGMIEELPWDLHKPYIKPPEGEGMKCNMFRSVFELVLNPHLQGDTPLVEYFREEHSFVAKVRGKWNEWLEGLSLEDLVKLLKQMRELLNAFGYKTAKLQCSVHEGRYEGKTNIRIIYNPKWRRYENFEIFFRNKTQSGRKKRD